MVSLTDGGRILLCGVPGTGKSMLLQDLYAALRAQGRSVGLLQHGDREAETADAEILLVDEADRLTSEQIRQLCQRPGALVMAGLPGLRERMADCAGLIDSITLDPLSKDDVVRLVRERLSAAGRPSTLFAPQAVAALSRHSGGLFRVVIILAGAALFFAELRGAEVVASSDVEEAASMREAIADEVVQAAVAEPTPARAVDFAGWLRGAVMATVAIVAVVGVAVHLAATAGGSAAAAVETARAPAGSSRLLPVSAEPAPPAPLAPKHKLPPAGPRP